MAIITISRKIASLGDETAMELAKLLNYEFIDRKLIEEDLIRKGISKSQLKKYDERKPGFWASLSREKDEYFDYLRETIYEHAAKDNCIFIGRGGFAILRDVPGLYSVRLVASDEIRVKRLMNEFNLSEKQAKALIFESDENRDGFHKNFFNTENENSSEYNLVLNTGLIDNVTAAEIIKFGFERTLNKENAEHGKKRIQELLLGQKIVNHISFNLKLQIYFLETEVSNNEVILHGVANNHIAIEKAISTAKDMAPEMKISSALTIVNEYKPFP